MCRQAVKPKRIVKVIEAAKEGQKLHRDFGLVRSGQEGDMLYERCGDALMGDREELKLGGDCDTVRKEVGLK